MATERPGEKVREAARETTSRVVLIAPFVKAQVLHRIVEWIREDVQVTVVTRWNIEEVASGASDLEAWDVISRRRQGDLLLHPTIHAKYYRFDDQVLIGSANLTGRALGWVTPANVELLEWGQVLPEFERRVMRWAYPPTLDLYQAMQEAVTDIRRIMPRAERAEVSGVDERASERDREWTPQTRHPEDVYLAYVGKGDELARAARESTTRDLEFLEPPPGLSKQTFVKAIGATLLGRPIVRDLDAYLLELRRFGEVRDWLAERLDIDRQEAARQWQTLMRWLLHFLPDRYIRTRPQYSEGFQRVNSG